MLPRKMMLTAACWAGYAFAGSPAVAEAPTLGEVLEGYRLAQEGWSRGHLRYEHLRTPPMPAEEAEELRARLMAAGQEDENEEGADAPAAAVDGRHWHLTEEVWFDMGEGLLWSYQDRLGGASFSAADQGSVSAVRLQSYKLIRDGVRLDHLPAINSLTVREAPGTMGGNLPFGTLFPHAGHLPFSPADANEIAAAQTDDGMLLYRMADASEPQRLEVMADSGGKIVRILHYANDVLRVETVYTGEVGLENGVVLPETVKVVRYDPDSDYSATNFYTIVAASSDVDIDDGMRTLAVLDSVTIRNRITGENSSGIPEEDFAGKQFLTIVEEGNVGAGVRPAP